MTREGTRHLDLDALADLLAGEGRDSEVRHVAGCPACSSALDDLDRAQEPVRRALAGLPEPTVPGDLAARLDAALLHAWEQADAEHRPVAAPVRAVRPDPYADDPGRTGSRVVALAPRRRRPRPAWLLSGAAGVVLLVAAVLALGDSLRGAGDSSTSASSGSLAAPVPAAGTPATSSSGRDYGVGGDAVAAALPQLLAGSPAATRPEAVAGAGGDELARLRDPAALAACLAALPDTGAPLALDYARYADRPALVVVLASRDPDRVDVLVVGAGCGAGAPDVLLRTPLARPS